MKRMIAGLMFLLLALPLQAQQYKLGSFVLGAGGSRSATNGVDLSSTCGIPVIGQATNDSISVFYGYWHFPEVYTSVDQDNKPPKYVFGLKQNYPNPFNPTTTIPYSVGSGQIVLVTLSIYDVRGALVKALIHETKQPGNYKALWDGRNESGRKVASGIYFYQIKAKDLVQTKKLVLLR